MAVFAGCGRFECSPIDTGHPDGSALIDARPGEVWTGDTSFATSVATDPRRLRQGASTLPWMEAGDACAAMGGRLAIPRSRQDVLVLRRVRLAPPFFPWLAGDSNASVPGEDCAVASQAGPSSGMNDETCGPLTPQICRCDVDG